jgi:hypothetical protein
MTQLIAKTVLLSAICGWLATPAFSQEARFVPVNAPYAQSLVQKLMSAHPDLAFIGIHVTPPGGSSNVIIACTDPKKIGQVSSDKDMELVTAKATRVQFNKAHNDYEVDAWFTDGSGEVLGMLVYHFSGTVVTSEQDAVTRATGMRSELQNAIPNRERLFKE